MQHVLKPLDVFVGMDNPANTHPQFSWARTAADVIRTYPAQDRRQHRRLLGSSPTPTLTVYEHIEHYHFVYAVPIAI